MDLLQAILSLIGVLGLILVLFYYLRKLGKNPFQTNGRRLKIIDRIAVGRDSALAVVCVCDKLMLVGISTHGVTKLCDIGLTESEYLSLSSENASFSEILSSLTGFSAGKKKNASKADNPDNLDNSDKSEGEIPLETNDFASDETE